MKNLKNSLFFKISVISFLILVLLIPTSMVKGLIREREYTHENAIKEVSSKWGRGQLLSGPFLTIPYDKYIKRYDEKDSVLKVVKTKEYLHYLPDNLSINGEIIPEKRHRGIYEVVVYVSKLNIKGNFKKLNVEQFDINPNDVHFDKAVLNVGISDLKGIEKQIKINWNTQNIPFNSGVTTNEIIGSGVHANVPVDFQRTDNIFSTEIDLKGSQYLYFLPFGKTTDITLQSNWKTPSFTGTFLPDDNNVSSEGFTAHWNILHLNRNYPQAWIGGRYDVIDSSFGTDLLLPVDNYKKTYRVAKYAILFLVLTFMVFFFVEVLKKVFIHPIQYLLVGFAILLFYTLLLSFSEYIRFNFAYIIATVLTLGLITLYTTAILKSKRIGSMIFGILLTMYLFIFTIIQLEDLALKLI